MAAMATNGSAVLLTEAECVALMNVSTRWATCNTELAASLGIVVPTVPVVVPVEPEVETPEAEVLQPLPKASKPVLEIATDGRDTLINYYPGRARKS
jgi:hypothetical protein